MKILVDHLSRAFNLTEDLAESFSNNTFERKLQDLPSNTIGQQMWCIIGARESYLKAIVNNGWIGFSCSLKNTKSKEDILQCLKQSACQCIDFLSNQQLNETQVELVISLLEHEIQHHGQLIRYVYGNKLGFPKSWNNRYTV